MKATFDVVVPLTYTNLAPTCFVGCHLVIDFEWYKIHIGHISPMGIVRAC